MTAPQKQSIPAWCLAVLLALALVMGALPAMAEESEAGKPDDSVASPEATAAIPDPLEPVNRIFFEFNDRLYFWVLKPVASGYAKVVPEGARVSVRNFFTNLYTPIRIINCLLQGKLNSAGIELSRLMVNTLLGFGGLFDVGGKGLGLPKQDEDFGQTLGFYGIGPGLYLVWPILGPSSLRDTAGMAGDYFLNPLNYAGLETGEKVGTRSFETVNATSLRLGEYEDLKRAALDPYVALRDAYDQHRRSKIER